MRVAETKDEYVQEADLNDQEEKAQKVDVVSNDEFFMNYTKDEYIKFAARTDIEAPEYVLESECNGENENNEEIEDILENEIQNDQSGSDSDDGDFDPLSREDDDSDEDDEDCQVGMMNLIFGQILKRFREENGRGPDTRELLDMRKALAERLGVEVPPIDESGSDWDEKVKTDGKVKTDENVCETSHDDQTKRPSTDVPSKKRALDSDNSNSESCRKRVKFVIEDEIDSNNEHARSSEATYQNETNDESDDLVLKIGESEI